MPVMDGIVATAKIRELENEKGSPRSSIVALTAADTDRSLLRQRHTELGFNELVGKPLSKNVFCRLLDKYILT